MPNMSYCRFENTYRDLLQCLDAIRDDEELSESEEMYKERVINLCQQILDEDEWAEENK